MAVDVLKDKLKMESQRFGFIAENMIREAVFGLPAEINSTAIHDIPRWMNKFDHRENISIKTTKSKILHCGDIIRFFDYDFAFKNTLIVARYKQITASQKKIIHIYELDYNAEVHRYLFGSVSRQDLVDFVACVKAIPPGPVSKDIRSTIKSKARQLRNSHCMKAIISPKIDSHEERRVEIAIPDAFDMFLCIGCVNRTDISSIRGTPIETLYESPQRKRNKKEENKA